MKTYPLHVRHFFNIFIHTEYISSNKGADLTVYNCPQESKATLSSSAGIPGCTPGFRVALETIVGYKYFLETDAVITSGKDAFLYIENCDGIKLIERINHHFEPCRRIYYGITFEAISNKTFVGILFFCSDVANTLKINQFRVSPFLDINNFVDANVEQWKCIGGQLGQPSGCTACTPDDCPPMSELYAGAQGPAGPQGNVGSPGEFGATGAQGAPGPQGSQGSIGSTGSQGVQGPAGVQGPLGSIGPPGSAGPQGPQGASGLQGPLGPTGVTGPDGLVGSTGLIGPTGNQGNQGDQGVIGLVGSIGPVGPLGPTGPTGPEPTSGMWTTTWNNSGDMTEIIYQVINDVVTFFIPNISFFIIGTDTILSTTMMPSEITPLSDQVYLTIINPSSGASFINRTTVLSSGALLLTTIDGGGFVSGGGTSYEFPSSVGGPGTPITYHLSG